MDLPGHWLEVSWAWGDGWDQVGLMGWLGTSGRPGMVTKAISPPTQIPQAQAAQVNPGELFKVPQPHLDQTGKNLWGSGTSKPPCEGTVGQRG